MPFSPVITTAEVLAVAADLTSSDLSVFISHAELIADEDLAGKGLSDERIRMIGIYLAAHFASQKEPQIQKEKIGATDTTHNMKSDLALSSTTYGQQALALDPTGTLANLSHVASGKKEKKPYYFDVV